MVIATFEQAAGSDGGQREALTQPRSRVAFNAARQKTVWQGGESELVERDEVNYVDTRDRLVASDPQPRKSRAGVYPGRGPKDGTARFLAPTKALGLLLLAGLALTTLTPTHAEAAGTYTVHSCQTPSGTPAAVDWERDSRWTLGYPIGNGCPTGAFSFGLNPAVTHVADNFIQYWFEAPTGTEIHSYSLWRSLQLDDDFAAAVREYQAEGSEYFRREYCQGRAGCQGLGNPAVPLDGSNLLSVSGLSGVDGLRINLVCDLSDTSSERCPSGSSAVNFQLHRADVQLVDHFAPEFEQPPEGPLLSSDAPLIGEQQVWISASDQGGGIYEVVFELDGKIAGRATLDDNDGRCLAPFAYAQPCAEEAEGVVSFDTAQVPDGEHRLRVLVTDPTGSNAAVWGQIPIRTANDACNPDPRIESRRVRAWFAGEADDRKRLRVGFGARPRVEGRLTTESGDPVARAKLCVAGRNQAARSSLRQLRTTRTDAQGRFSFRVPPGPSRRVYVVSRTSDGAAAASVRLKVQARVRFGASRDRLRNGERVTLRGKVPGRPLPRRGVLVEIQARRETGWQTFGTTRSNHKGEFRFGYRFTRTTGVQRYKLRAHVPRQGTYPYEAGSSSTIEVKVAG